MPTAGFTRGTPEGTAGHLPERSRLRTLATGLLLLGAALLLASCGMPQVAQINSIDQVDLRAKTPAKITDRGDGPVLKSRAKQARYELFPGTSGDRLEDGEEPPPGVGAEEDGKFTVNVDEATIGEAAKLILGETLGYNYILDPRVQGSITLVSNRPLSSRELLNSFEAALRLAGAALIQSDGSYKIVALQEVLEGEMGQPDMGKSVSSGYGVSAIPLRYISPQTLMELIDSFIARAGTVRASKIGNLILIRGPAEERKSLADVVLSFDVDWMKSQTASMAILENGRAEDVASKVEAIFAEDSANAGSNGIKVIPVPRLNGVIVIANSTAKVRRAVTWIRRLDQESITEPNYYVYAVQNGSAVELAKILRATFGSGGGDAGTTAEVAPNKETTEVSMDTTPAASQPATGNSGGTPANTPDQQGADAVTTGSAPAETSAEDSSGSDSGNGIRITPNPANNTIVIRATPKDYRKILATLSRIDAPATQVLINTTIAEVSLTNELRYGIQAYFEANGFGAGFFGSKTTTQLKPSLPGLNFLWGGLSDPKVVIDALSAITKVRVVSSPSILVLENETATIKVGDQVPIQTQDLTSDGGNNVQSFEYRDTGVILKVKPRVNANGMVAIDLGQELSAVRPLEGASPGGNPTFTQRAINSKVLVNDQQTVLLGGLISGREDSDKATVPGAGKIPVLGDLVGTNSKLAQRTELIVFITPRIVRNGEEASRESQELRDKMKNLNFN